MNRKESGAPPRNKPKDDPLFFAFLATVAWAPMPFGSNHQWAWSLLEIMIFSILTIWLFIYSRKPFDLPQAVKTAGVPLLMLCVWAGLTLLQMVPLPVGLLGIVSPATSQLYIFASSGGEIGSAPVSVDPGATLAEFLKICSYVAIFFLSMVLLNNHDRVRALASVLLFVGLAGAVYGLFNTLSGTEYIWWIPKEHYKGFVTGTFINRNHFAGHLEMVIPIGIGLMMAMHPKLRYAVNWKVKLRNILSLILESWGRMVIYLMILFAALFLSASRAGVASLFLAIATAYLIVFLSRGVNKRDMRFALFILGMAAIAALWLGLGALPERYGQIDESVGGRAGVWHPAATMAGDYLVFGSGAGTFQYLFPLYEDGSLTGYYDHAHNDYIEVLTDHGLVGAFFMFGAIFILLFTIIKGNIKRRDPLMRGMAFASFAGTLSLMFHATVDFNFYIPANMAYFFVLLGLGVSVSVLRHESSGGGR